MGIFNKTEEEKKQEEERRRIYALKDYILSSDQLDEYSTRVLISYINDVMSEAKSNDFFDIDFLCRVFYKLDSNEYSGETDMRDHLNKVIACVHELLPFGKKTPNYEEIKEYIIDNFVDYYGYINKGIYSYDMYSMLKDLPSYARIMKAIEKNEMAVEHFQSLTMFMNKVGKYTTNRDVYVQSTLSTINCLNRGVLDVDRYLDSQLEEDKKRVGIYSVNHDDIVAASNIMRKLDSQIDRINGMLESFEDKKKEAQKFADDGVLRVGKAKEDAIRELKNMKSMIFDELKKMLDSYIDALKVDLDNKADAVFSTLLTKYQEQLAEFRKQSESLSNANTRSLLVLKDETEKSLAQLREYVSNNPELQAYLDKAEQSAELRDKLLDLIATEKETLGSLSTSKEKDAKMVEGIGRIVVPDSPTVAVPESIVLPKNIQIIPAYSYKNAQEYSKKLKAIEAKIKENQRNGVIYHSKIMEIIKCLMVGDWPYMFGPSGAGKGYIVKQVGELLGQHVVDGGKIGEVHTVLGYIDAQGRFRATPAVGACINGDLIFFDEFDNGNSDTRVALNTMYSNLRDKIQDPSSNQYIKFAGEIDIPINPNMRMIAAGNTDGTGSDELFTDRYPTDESIKERYKPIYVAYDNKVEASILRDYKDWYDFFVSFRECCERYASSQGLQSAPGNASTRDASDILRDVSLNAKTLDEMMSEYFVQIKDNDYRETIGREIADEYNISSDQRDSKDYSGPINKATGSQIAKQFVKRCNLGIRG